MSKITIISLIFLCNFPTKTYAQYEKYLRFQSVDEAIKEIDNDIINIYRGYGLEYKSDLMDNLEYRFLNKGNMTGFIEFKSNTFNELFQILSIVYEKNYDNYYKSSLVQDLQNNMVGSYLNRGSYTIEKLTDIRECFSMNVNGSLYDSILNRYYVDSLSKNYKQNNVIEENAYDALVTDIFVKNNWKNCVFSTLNQYSNNNNYIKYFDGIKINIIPSDDFIVGVNKESRVLKMSIGYFNQLVRSIELNSRGYLGLEAIKAYAYNDIDKLESIIDNMNEYSEYKAETINRLSSSNNAYSLKPDLEENLINSSTFDDIANNIQLLVDDMMKESNNTLDSMVDMEDILYEKYNIYYDLMRVYGNIVQLVFMHEMAHVDGYVLKNIYNDKNCDESFEGRIDNYAVKKLTNLMEENFNVTSIKTMFDELYDDRIDYINKIGEIHGMSKNEIETFIGKFGSSAIEMDFDISNNDINHNDINSFNYSLILDTLSSYSRFIQKIPIKSECQRRSLEYRMDYIDREIKEKCIFIEGNINNGEINKDLLGIFQKICF